MADEDELRVWVLGCVTPTLEDSVTIPKRNASIARTVPADRKRHNGLQRSCRLTISTRQCGKTFGNNLPRGDAALPTTGIEIEKFQETGAEVVISI
jgi:hypothetical protein